MSSELKTREEKMVKFSVGDKVFAKVRGYPAWPARVEAVADATPNKVKYHVFFYGTLETAVCKSEDIYPYAEHKETYGKPSKRRLFNEGLAQIEGLLSVPEIPRRNNVNQHDGDDEEDDEGTLVIDENPAAKYGKPIKRKRDSDATGDHGDDKFNTSGPSTSEVKNRRGSLPVQKRLKKDSTSSSGDAKGNDQSPSSKQEIVSRSGRKIKPKRFADEDTFNNATSVSPFPENAKDASATAAANFPLKAANKKEPSASLLARVKERRRRQLQFWKKELEMLKQEERLKMEFNINKPNPEQGLTILNEFLNMGIEPLMLKKHPYVVETIKKLCRYVGNPVGWKYSKEQKKSFAAICEKVKQKAKLVIDKFAVMFNITDVSTFYDVFLERVAELKNKTKKWEHNKFLAMVEDPTVKQIENKKNDVKKPDVESRCSSDAENGLQEEE